MVTGDMYRMQHYAFEQKLEDLVYFAVSEITGCEVDIESSNYSASRGNYLCYIMVRFKPDFTQEILDEISNCLNCKLMSAFENTTLESSITISDDHPKKLKVRIFYRKE